MAFSLVLGSFLERFTNVIALESIMVEGYIFVYLYVCMYIVIIYILKPIMILFNNANLM